jgi:hypothetical protein
MATVQIVVLRDMPDPQEMVIFWTYKDKDKREYGNILSNRPTKGNHYDSYKDMVTWLKKDAKITLEPLGITDISFEYNIRPYAIYAETFEKIKAGGLHVN